MDAPTIKFKTSHNNTCYVKITKNGVSPISRDLLLGMPAIKLETDADTDIDATVLQTTGTMSLILTEENAMAIGYMMPDELLDTRVTISLEKDGVEKTMFDGYAVLQEYSQPYDSYPYQMDINLKGILSLFEDLSVEAKDDTDYARVHPFAYYLMEAMEAAGFTPSKVIVNADDRIDFLADCIQREWFLEESVENVVSGTSETVSLSVNGISWQEVFERILLPNALVMWQDGDCLYIQSKNQSKYYCEYSWADIEAIANGESVTVETLSIPEAQSFADVIYNMSNDNKQNFLLPCKALSINQSLDDSDLFKINADWFDTWYIEALTDSNWISYLFRSSCLQRGVTLTRRLYSGNGELPTLADDDDDPEPQWTDLPDSTHIGHYGTYGTGYQVGAAVGFLQTVHKYNRSGDSNADDEDDPISLESPTPKFYLMGARANWNGVPAIEIICPVCLGDMDGAVCINMTLKSIATDTADRINSVTDDLQGAIHLRGQLSIINTQTGAALQSKNICMLFDSGGKLLTNCKNNEERYEAVSEAILENSECMKYDEVEGYVYPVNVPRPDAKTNYYVRAIIYAPTINDVSGGDSQYIYEVGDLALSFHRRVISSDGKTYYPDSTDKKINCLALVSLPTNGEELSIDVDTWVNSIASVCKDSRTLQPPILNMANWNSLFNEIKVFRKVIEFDDARMDGDPLALVAGYDGNTYRQVGCGSWDSETEGGKKTYIQVIPNGSVDN